MFRTLKSSNVAPFGTRPVGNTSRSLSYTAQRHPVAELSLLGALSVTFLTLALAAKPAPAQTGAMGTGVTVVPGGRGSIVKGMTVAVISATDTGGNAEMASRALATANSVIARWPGFTAIPTATVASAISRINPRGGLLATDYRTVGKRIKAQRLLSITLIPGPQSDSSSNYTAIAELIDTQTGGLVGRGQAPFTATPDNATAITGATGLAAAATPTGSLGQRAVDSAVTAAIMALNEPATLQGVVVSIPGAYQARLSVGERNGLRNGAQIEYVSNGQTLAYGTVIEVDVSTAVATVAAEAANPSIMVNTEFRTVSNPPIGRAGPTRRQMDDKEWTVFQRNFALAAIPALAYQYYAFGF